MSAIAPTSPRTGGTFLRRNAIWWVALLFVLLLLLSGVLVFSSQERAAVDVQ